MPRESLNNLSAACNDPGNDKWISKLASAHWLAHVKDVLNAGKENIKCIKNSRVQNKSHLLANFWMLNIITNVNYIYIKLIMI